MVKGPGNPLRKDPRPESGGLGPSRREHPGRSGVRIVGVVEGGLTKTRLPVVEVGGGVTVFVVVARVALVKSVPGPPAKPAHARTDPPPVSVTP